MILARFTSGDEPRYGIVQGLDYTERCDLDFPDTARLVVLKGDPLFGAPEATGEVIPLNEVRLLSPVIPRSKVVGLGSTYDGEAGSLTEPPFVFLKPNTAVIGTDTPIIKPDWSQTLVHEAELAIIIKDLCKDVDPADAARHVLGYTVANDVAAPSDNIVRSKSFDTACPLGPWIYLPEADDEFNPANARVTLRIDGEVVGEGNTANLNVSIENIVASVSRMFTLLPGDVILTGAAAYAKDVPAGVGIAAQIDGLGRIASVVR